jgi:hypothetical protein
MDRWKDTKTYRPDYQTADGGTQRSLKTKVSETLLHGGLDSSAMYHVSCIMYHVHVSCIMNHESCILYYVS